MAGITPEGFDRKLLTDIVSDFEAAQRAAFGAGFDNAADTAAGQLNGIFGSSLAELWEILEECWHGSDPDAAAGYLLTALSALTGTARRGATASTVPLVLNLDAGATVAAGALVAHEDRPDIVFSIDADVTNGGGSAADVPASATCTATGPTVALAGTLTVIVNPATGWNSVTNPGDAVLGRNVDSDAVLRQRREAQLALRGGSTVAAIRADLLALTEVQDAFVIENTTDTTVDTLPPHSFEAVVDDGDTPAVDDDELAQVIWDSKPAGIATAGGLTGTATDETGADQLVNFSRVTRKPVYISITVEANDDYPIDGDAQVKAALVLYGTQNYGLGDDVIALALRAQGLAVAGVTDVPTFTLGFAPAPVGTSNLAVATRERATFASANITVTVI